MSEADNGAETAAMDDAEDHHWFEGLADHMGPAYLRYSFTKGTRQEIDFLVEVLELDPSTRVLDVGCGPGRHAHELARRGIPVHGIDISHRFIDIARANAPTGATFERLDARSMSFDGEFDRVISLCQGGFGLLDGAGEDASVLSSMKRALRENGRLALSAFNAYFCVKYQTEADFDAAAGIAHEVTEIRNEQGKVQSADLWTTCYTPRELLLLLTTAGLSVDHIWSVEPGKYCSSPPSVDSAEYLAIAAVPDDRATINQHADHQSG